MIQKYANLCIGTVQGEKPEVIEQGPGDLSLVPYAEPLWLSPQFKSPYYNESHRRLRQELRVFVDTVIKPEAQEKEADGTYISQGLMDNMAANNLLAMRLGPGKHLKGRKLLGDVKPEEFDPFHDLACFPRDISCHGCSADSMLRSSVKKSPEPTLVGMNAKFFLLPKILLTITQLPGRQYGWHDDFTHCSVSVAQ